MVLLFLFSLISYKFLYSVEPNETFLLLPFQYGFRSGGNYSIQVTNGEATDVYLLFIKKEMESINDTEINDACENLAFDTQSNNHVVQIQKGEFNISGTIKEKSKYNTTIVSCSNINNGFTIYIVYQNPNSIYGYDIEKFLCYIGIFIFLGSVLFLIWIIFWINYFSMKNLLHLFYTIYFFYYVIEKISFYYEIKLLNESNQISTISKARPYIKLFRDIIFTFATFLSSFGFYIFLDKKYFTDTISSIVCSLLTSFLNFVDYYRNTETAFIFSGNALMIMVLIIHFGCIFFSSYFNCLYFGLACCLVFDYSLYILEYEVSSSSNLDKIGIVIDSLYIFIQFILAFLMRMRRKTREDYSSIYSMSKSEIITIRLNKRSYSFSKISEIIIPKNITIIQENAFYKCENLTTVEFEMGIQLLQIDSSAFAYSSIVHIKIPPSVTDINQYAFSYCKKLQSIEFIEPSHILVFKNFLYESSIQKINIPSSLEEFKSGWCCEVCNLSDIVMSNDNQCFTLFQSNFILGKLPNSSIFNVLIFAKRNVRIANIPSFINEINENAFNNCIKLKKIKFSDNSKLFFIDSYSFSKSSIDQITIPSSVIRIGSYAFYNCKHLHQVEFKDNSNLLQIESNAFSRTSIVSIRIPSRVFEIGPYAFSNCTKLCNVDISDDSNLSIINKYAFCNSSIKSFIISSNVSIIGENAFSNCRKLQIIEVRDGTHLCRFNKYMFKYTSQIIITAPPKIIERFIE